jgi:elongation factor P--(R)-beta-lysine ligase
MRAGEPASPSSDAGRLRSLRDNLRVRGRALDAIRRFFLARGFLEVETPVRVRAPALELHIDAEPSGDCYLRTSPELHMKRLLQAGCERIFQLGPCFRRGERGDLHREEFTMLEWYRAQADYGDILRDAQELIPWVVRESIGSVSLPYQGLTVRADAAWVVRAVSEVFLEAAGWDPAKEYDADRFDRDLVEKVEPALPRDVPVVLMDYPAECAALARLKPGDPRRAERWELYLGGLELANAFSELTDPEEQRRRFAACAQARRGLGRTVYPLDEAFLAALKEGLPPCGGVALGVDRLLMLLCNARTIDEVRTFES